MVVEPLVSIHTLSSTTPRELYSKNTLSFSKTPRGRVTEKLVSIPTLSPRDRLVARNTLSYTNNKTPKGMGLSLEPLVSKNTLSYTTKTPTYSARQPQTPKDREPLASKIKLYRKNVIKGKRTEQDLLAVPTYLDDDLESLIDDR
eukprot:UN17281